MSRTVLVTGGGTGLGRATAARFVAAGDEVTITGRRSDVLAAAASELGARALTCDATDPDAVERLAEQLGPRVDVVVHMAGGNTDFGGPADPSLKGVAAAWQANLDVNVLGTVLTTTAVLPAIPRGGAIVACGSIGAEYAASSYGAAKAAVAAWTAGLSATVGPRGITVNTIAPGYIEDTEFFGAGLAQERRAALVEATHDKRPGRPEDVAGLAFFLASADARHITGQTLQLNGGAHTTR